MVHAEYEDGHKYHAGNLYNVDLTKFTVDGLASLRVGKFTWDKTEHGTPLYHALRTERNLRGHAVARIYVLVTTKKKIFIGHDNRLEIREDWLENHPYLSKCEPTFPDRLAEIERRRSKAMAEAI